MVETSISQKNSVASVFREMKSNHQNSIQVVQSTIAAHLSFTILSVLF